jgi:hypothetical protein
VPLDQRPADQTVRDHHQRAVHGAAAIKPKASPTRA